MPDQPSLSTDHVGVGLGRIFRQAPSSTPAPAPVPPPPAPAAPRIPTDTSTDYPEFFTGRDFRAVSGLQHTKENISVTVAVVAPEAGGPVINGFRCNDILDIRIRIGGDTTARLMAKYREVRDRLHAAIRKQMDTAEFQLTSIEIYEGSLWAWLKVKCKTAASWMQQQSAKNLKWARDHKDQIAYFSNLISNLVNIARAILKILSWLFGGGGGDIDVTDLGFDF